MIKDPHQFPIHRHNIQGDVAKYKITSVKTSLFTVLHVQINDRESDPQIITIPPLVGLDSSRVLTKKIQNPYKDK